MVDQQPDTERRVIDIDALLADYAVTMTPDRRSGLSHRLPAGGEAHVADLFRVRRTRRAVH